MQLELERRVMKLAKEQSTIMIKEYLNMILEEIRLQANQV
jgi:hypothetical protein